MTAWRYAKTLATTDPIRGSPLANNGCVKRSKISDSPTVNALSYSEFFRINYLPVGVASFYRGRKVCGPTFRRLK